MCKINCKSKCKIMCKIMCKSKACMPITARGRGPALDTSKTLKNQRFCFFLQDYTVVDDELEAKKKAVEEKLREEQRALYEAYLARQNKT